MTNKKIKVLTLGDMPLSTSGVGLQSRFMIEALLNSGKFEVFSLGGAIKHPQYKIIKLEQYGDDWKILPVDKFGSKELLRSAIWKEKPDILWFMTDPRFWGWLWEMDNEIRANLPMVYYHVWDNYPYPKFNKKFYESNDVIVSISKLTNDIVKNVAPDVELHHIQHAVKTENFKDLGKEVRRQVREDNGFLKNGGEEKFVVLFNSRNARRKHSGTLIFWFKEFLDKVGHDNACLLMHTDPQDPNGPDLDRIVKDLDLQAGQVLFSREKLTDEKMAVLYNMASVTVNISDAEGFGLSCLESLASCTPVIATKTGGLQEQITDGENEFGVSLNSASMMIVGSQNVPYVGEDRVSKQEFLDALEKIYNMSEDQRTELGTAGRAHVMKNYNFENFNKSWVGTLEKVHKKYGSWKNRKKFNKWRVKEL